MSFEVRTFAVSGPAPRTGVLLVLRDREGRVGLGEAAPLRGFSSETAEDVIRALLRWAEEQRCLLDAFETIYDVGWSRGSDTRGRSPLVNPRVHAFSEPRRNHEG